MSIRVDALRHFQTSQASELVDLLMSKQVVSKEEAEATVYALLHIAESIEKVYGELLPKLLSEPDSPRDMLEERLWEVREEFGHIDYHIHDALHPVTGVS